MVPHVVDPGRVRGPILHGVCTGLGAAQPE